MELVLYSSAAQMAGESAKRTAIGDAVRGVSGGERRGCYVA